MFAKHAGTRKWQKIINNSSQAEHLKSSINSQINNSYNSAKTINDNNSYLFQPLQLLSPLSQEQFMFQVESRVLDIFAWFKFFCLI